MRTEKEIVSMEKIMADKEKFAEFCMENKWTPAYALFMTKTLAAYLEKELGTLLVQQHIGGEPMKGSVLQ